MAICEQFIEDCGGIEASDQAYAIAAILAVSGGQKTRKHYIQYRYQLLNSEDRSLLLFKSFFLRELNSTQLFEANDRSYYFGSTSKLAHGKSDEMKRLEIAYPKINLKVKSIRGAEISIPNGKNNQYTFACFVNKVTTPEEILLQTSVLKKMNETVKDCRNNSGRLVLFFRNRTVEEINEMISNYNLRCDAVNLDNKNDQVVYRQLGVFSPKSHINTSVICPNGDLLANFSKSYHKPLYSRKAQGYKGYIWFDCMDADILDREIREKIRHYDHYMGQKAFDQANWSLAVQHLPTTFGYSVRGNDKYKGMYESALKAHKNPKEGLNYANGRIRYRTRRSQVVDYTLYEARARVYEQLGQKENADKDWAKAKKSKKASRELELLNAAIKNHEVRGSGSDFRQYESRAKIYDNMGMKGAAARDRDLAARLKAKADGN